MSFLRYFFFNNNTFDCLDFELVSDFWGITWDKFVLDLLFKKLILLAILLCRKTQIIINYNSTIIILPLSYFILSFCLGDNNVITILSFSHYMFSLYFGCKMFFLSWHKCHLKIVRGNFGKCILQCTVKLLI
jgi:hypothetical protein